jgi:hypothetical protein
VFLFALSLPWVTAACSFLEKDEPKPVLVVLLIAELAAAVIRIVIGAVLQCRERTRGTPLRARRSDVETHQQNDGNPGEAEQCQNHGSKAELEEQEPDEAD